MKLLPPKWSTHVFSFFMSLLMSCIMSLAISLLNVGFVDQIIMIWLKAWLLSFVIAFPTIVAVTPVVKKLVNLVIDTDHTAQ